MLSAMSGLKPYLHCNKATSILSAEISLIMTIAGAGKSRSPKKAPSEKDIHVLPVKVTFACSGGMSVVLGSVMASTVRSVVCISQLALAGGVNGNAHIPISYAGSPSKVPMKVP